MAEIYSKTEIARMAGAGGADGEIVVVGKRGTPVVLFNDAYYTQWNRWYSRYLGIINSAITKNINVHKSGFAINKSSDQTQEMKDAIAAAAVAVKLVVAAATGEGSSVQGNAKEFSGPEMLGSREFFKYADMIDLASRIQFEIVDGDFGPSRAGENGGIGSDGLIHVKMGSKYFLQYYRLGHTAASDNPAMNYLVAHEMAHVASSGQYINQLMWSNYLLHPEVQAMNAEQRSLNYDSTYQEFRTNEAYANTLGDNFLNAIKQAGLPEPTNGFVNGYIYSR